MGVVTEHPFEVNNKKFTRIYFHSPIKYSSILKKYKGKILSFSELLNLKKVAKGNALKLINSWNLCSDLFSNISLNSCKINFSQLEFIKDNNSQFSLYLGLEPKKKEFVYLVLIILFI